MQMCYLVCAFGDGGKGGGNKSEIKSKPWSVYKEPAFHIKDGWIGTKLLLTVGNINIDIACFIFNIVKIYVLQNVKHIFQIIWVLKCSNSKQ